MLNIFMSNSNVNPGLDALYRYATTQPYRTPASWTNATEFVPDKTLANNAPFVKQILVEAEGIEPF